MSAARRRARAVKLSNGLDAVALDSVDQIEAFERAAERRVLLSLERWAREHYKMRRADLCWTSSGAEVQYANSDGKRVAFDDVAAECRRRLTERRGGKR